MALIVQSMETVVIDLPFRRLQRFSALGSRNQSIVLVRLRSRDGLEGVGEAVTPSGPWWGGESIESIKTTLDIYVAPLLVGSDATSPRALLSRLDGQLHGNSFAKAATEMAVYDLLGKALDQPVHVLLGGAVRTSMEATWPLATGDPDQEIEEAQEKIASDQARRFKLKMGAVDVRADVARAVTVARALAGRGDVRVDPNERWSEIDAAWAMPRLIDAGVEMVEQPFARWNLDAHARLSRNTRAVVMLDESVRTPQDILEAARREAVGLVSLKLMKSGGLLASRRIADLADALGVPTYMGTFLESSIGAQAGMQLCATLSSLPLGGELIGPLLLAEDLVEQPAEYRDHALRLHPGPGLGIRLDEAKVAAFRRDRTYSCHPPPAQIVALPPRAPPEADEAVTAQAST